MTDVAIVGTGLSGLAAAYALQKHGISYTLIDLKREMGGSLKSVTHDGFCFDTHNMGLADSIPPAYLAELGLNDALFSLREGVVAFEHGNGQLIDALAQRLNAPHLRQMAVSSLGILDGAGYSICLENGMILQAKAVMLAIPARYVTHVLQNVAPAVSKAFTPYLYDTVYRVSLGFRHSTLPAQLDFAFDGGHVFHQRTTYPTRAPEGGEVVQVGVRLGVTAPDADALLHYVLTHYGLPTPDAHFIAHTATTDPVSCYDDHHAERIAMAQAHLPQGIYLLGNDYTVPIPQRAGVLRLDERIAQAQNAVADLAQHFKEKRA